MAQLSREAAASLAKHRGDLSFSGLETVSGEAARELARHEHRLYLDGLASLTTEATSSFLLKAGLRLPDELLARIQGNVKSGSP